jgi:hypothetical protein
MGLGAHQTPRELLCGKPNVHLAIEDIFQPVKLQRPDRDTVCSHSMRDATANVNPILNKAFSHSWSKTHLGLTTLLIASDV